MLYKSLPSLILMLCLGGMLQAQSMLNTANEWTVVNYSFQTTDIKSTRYLFGETVTRNNQVYREVLASDQPSGSNGISINTYLREDGQGKVFMFRDSGPEQMLYNFNAALDEPFPFVANFDGCREISTTLCSLVVKNVDSISLSDGSRRKRLGVQAIIGRASFWAGGWIEGIGSSSGPLFDNYFRIDTANDLLCYRQADQLRLQLDPRSCFLTVGLDDVQRTGQVQVYPNPFRSSLSFHCTDIELRSYRLFNNLGQEVSSGKITNGERLELEELKSGSYILLLHAADGREIIQRVVK